MSQNLPLNFRKQVPGPALNPWEPQPYTHLRILMICFFFFFFFFENADRKPLNSCMTQSVEPPPPNTEHRAHLRCKKGHDGYMTTVQAAGTFQGQYTHVEGRRVWGGHSHTWAVTQHMTGRKFNLWLEFRHKPFLFFQPGNREKWMQPK